MAFAFQDTLTDLNVPCSNRYCQNQKRKNESWWCGKWGKTQGKACTQLDQMQIRCKSAQNKSKVDLNKTDKKGSHLQPIMRMAKGSWKGDLPSCSALLCQYLGRRRRRTKKRFCRRKECTHTYTTN